MKTKTLLFIIAGFLPIVYCLLPIFSLAQTPGEWTWMHGDTTLNSSGVFGIQCVPNPANTPPALYEPCEWKDNNGNFWLFGGVNGSNVYAALWKYDPITNMWTWMKGPNTVSDPGSYGIQGVPAASNLPPSRHETSCSWTDNAGNLWLYGGITNSSQRYGDLWKYDISTNEWTWM